MTIHERLRAEGWSDWMYSRPPRETLIEVFRVGWIQPSVETLPEWPIREYQESYGMRNIVGLYWRLTGIGKMQDSIF